MRTVARGRSFVLAAISSLLFGCNGDELVSPDDSVFDRSALIEGLRNRGASVQTGSPLTQPFFSVGGQILRVNGEDVQTFEYASTAEAQAEAARISPDGFTIGTTMVSWVATPHFFLEGRVIAVYVGDNDAVTEPLAAVMGAQFAGG